jgi:hypothetical protein
MIHPRMWIRCLVYQRRGGPLSENALWAKRVAEHDAGTVDVPEPGPEPTLEDCAADIERQCLFRIVEDLAKWENIAKRRKISRVSGTLCQRRSCLPIPIGWIEKAVS